MQQQAAVQVSPDGTHALTSSKDKTAKIIDLETLQVIRMYTHTRPVNSAAMSPLEHVRAACLLPCAPKPRAAWPRGDRAAGLVHRRKCGGRC